MHLQQEELLLLWGEVMRDQNLDSLDISQTGRYFTLLAKCSFFCGVSQCGGYQNLDSSLDISQRALRYMLHRACQVCNNY